MCGIAGYLLKEKTLTFESEKVLNLMAKSLHHRGPDAGAIWSSNEEGIGLAFRRLAIQDLSDNGMQPMHSSNDRFVIVFNGEIYNHLNLRNEIGKNHDWKSSSDTETLLEAFSLWGVEKTLTKADGMFSLCLYDRDKNFLYFAVDRFGEKPLYVTETKDAFFFASELKAINSLQIDGLNLDLDSMVSYTRYNYIPAPKTIYRNTIKLEGGTYLCINTKTENYFTKKTYWSLKEDIIDQRKKSNNSFEEAKKNIDKQIQKTVKKQMISDVPIGCLLSGGIDSSIITAIAAKISNQKIRTFSMGFEDKKFDESSHAKKIATFLGTQHTEYFVSMNDAKDLIPKIVDIYDEPFSDSSQIPTLMLTSCVSKSVKVALSGDAGDEIFGGYNRYRFIEKIDNFSSKNPKFVNNFIAFGLNNLNFKSRAERIYNAFSNSNKRIPQLTEKLDKVAALLKEENRDNMYLRSLKTFTSSDDLFHKEFVFQEPTIELSGIKNFTEKMMHVDSINYLPHDILVKVDRAAMHYSLETRIPFLDPDLVKAAWSLPIDYKIREGKGKFILREILKNYIPENIFERPKKGFNVPLDSWFRSSLKEWMHDILNEKTIKSQKIFNHKYINELLSKHANSQCNNGSKIWNLVIMQSWINKNIG